MKTKIKKIQTINQEIIKISKTKEKKAIIN